MMVVVVVVMVVAWPQRPSTAEPIVAVLQIPCAAEVIVVMVVVVVVILNSDQSRGVIGGVRIGFL
jgi:hypothetical protein